MSHPRESILYTYVVDPTSPCHLKKSNRIFEVNLDNEVAYTSNTTMRMYTVYSDSSNTASQKVAQELGVKGNYGAFSGSASMAVSSSSDSSVKTCRIDAYCKATIASVVAVGEFSNFPELFVTPAFKKAVNQLSLQDFCERVGVFYARDITVGGCVNKSYTMQATSEDTESSVKAELEASYGAGCWGVTGSSSTTVSTRTSNKHCDMKSEWKAQGGDTKIWLGCTFGPDQKTNADQKAEEWAKSLTEGNSYPISLTIKPIWEIVKKIDAKKGKDLETYLTKLWSEDVNKPSKFMESDKICKHKNAKKIIERAQSHHDWLRDQRADAQGYIDSFWHQAALTRNRNWRAACEDGMKIMDDIKKEVKGSKTVEEFRDWLHNKWKDCDENSKRNYGIGGHDSGPSNSVHTQNHGCIGEIKKMCS